MSASERRRAAGFWVGGAVVVTLLAVVLAGGTNEEPLDPRSVSPDGAKALVDLIEAFGADVELGPGLPDGGHEVAVLLDDSYGVADRELLEAWVRDGGRILVADPSSPLTPRSGPSPDVVSRGGCDVAALVDVDEIAGATATFRAPDDATSCLGGTVVVDPVGDGVVVSLGGPGPLLNDRLDDADNAVFAVAVLAPADGTRVAFLEPALPAGVGGERLVDLVSDEIWLLFIQMGVGFLVFAWWRARRLGAPVDEPLPVRIEGSELAAARGRMLESMRRPDAAADAMRTDTVRRLARTLGLPGDTSAVVVAERVAGIVDVDVGTVTAILAGPPPLDAAELATLGAELADLRAAVAGPVGPAAEPEGVS